jgi:hypothetical protein
VDPTVGGHLKVSVDLFHFSKAHFTVDEAVVTPNGYAQLFPTGDGSVFRHGARVEIERGFGVIFPQQFDQFDIIDNSIIPATGNFDHNKTSFSESYVLNRSNIALEKCFFNWCFLSVLQKMFRSVIF